MKIFISIIILSSSFVWSISPDANYYFEVRHELGLEANRVPSAEKSEEEKKHITEKKEEETAHKKAEREGAKKKK